MAAIVDPFDAKIVDPAELKPGSPAALQNRIKQGSPTGAAMTGFASSVFGLPGDLEYLGRAGVNLLGGNVSPKTVLPTTSGLEKKLAPFPEEVAAHPIATTVGELLPGAVPAGAALAKGAEVAGRAVKTALSGEKAIGEVGAIGKTSDMGGLGKDMLKTLRPDYAELYARRAAALEKAAPAERYIGATDTAKTALNAARAKVRALPEYATIGQFEKAVKDSRMGQKLLARTGKYSSVFKLDPADLPSSVFHSQATVEDFRKILSRTVADPEPIIEKFAGDYAARSLMERTAGKGAKEAAAAARSWATKNEGWLKETPLAKGGVEHFIKRLETVARNQRIAKIAAGTAAIGVGTGVAGSLARHYLWNALP